PGDRIVAFAGQEYGPNEGMDLRAALRVASGPTPLALEREGGRVPLTVGVIDNPFPLFANPHRTVAAGSLGVGLLSGYNAQQSPGEVVGYVGSMIGNTAEAITQIPSRVPAVFGAAFLGEERGADSPMGVVGVSRIGGEILAQEDVPWQQDVSLFLNVLAAV